MTVTFTKFQLDADGLDTLSLVPPTGDVLLGDVDLGFPQIREDVQPRPYRHGVYDRSTWYGSRTVTAAASAFTSAAAGTLLAFGTPGRRATVTFRRDSDDRDLRMALVARQPAAPMQVRQQSHLPVVLQWNAPDGVVESAEEWVAAAAIQSSGTGGLTWPLTWPLQWGNSGSAGTVDVVNAGTEPAWPLLRVDGPADTITLSNDTTGESVTVGYDLPAGQYLTVAPRDGAVYLNGIPSASLLDWVSGDAVWWQLQPGRNRVRLSALTGAAPAQVTVRWHDTYAW